MKFDYINSWKSKKKQWDKYAIKIRIGKLTFFDFYYDHSRRQFGMILFNLGVKALPQSKKR